MVGAILVVGDAKYGTYTVMDKQTGVIVDMHVSHVGVAGNSAGMELDGLKNVFQGLRDNVINISSLTTDTHKQVSYPVMIARVQLAVLDFNFGVGLAHRKNKQRDLQYKHQFSKITQSWAVKKIHERK